MSQFPEVRNFSGVASIRCIAPEKHPLHEYTAFHPGKKALLSVGHTLRQGYGAFRKSTVLDLDTRVQMRDGTTIYTNVYYSSDKTPQPALIAWSYFGKSAGHLGKLVDAGVRQNLSGYEKVHGPNPADWVERGYCVVDPDPRGVMYSEGNIHWYGPQDAMDIYDLIEWCTKQPWCDGTAVMFGIGELAVAQINHASLCPHPALKAIAPWGCWTNLYNDVVAPGGVVASELLTDLMPLLAGYNFCENPLATFRARPLYDEYWKSKTIDVTKITVPIYVATGYISQSYSRGSFETFAKVSSGHEWLRVHTTPLLDDLYKRQNMDDLQKFYDVFTKNKVKNGWLRTPALRLSLIGMDGGVSHDVVERSEPGRNFPLDRTRMEKFFFDCNRMTLIRKAPCNKAAAVYERHTFQHEISFRLSFEKYTELSGLPWARIFVSCEKGHDLDIHVLVRKHGTMGRQLLKHTSCSLLGSSQCVGAPKHVTFQGLYGVMKASHQASLKQKRHLNDLPIITHEKATEISPGIIVPVEILLGPIGMTFAEGEGMTVIFAGHDPRRSDFLVKPGMQIPGDANNANIGRQSFYSGGDTASFMVLPFIAG